jgi:hypothetical protein
MNKSQLRLLIQEVISEISTNEPTVNPSYEDVKISDVYLSTGAFKHNYVSTVLKIEPISKRFGKNDRIVAVKIQSWPEGNIIDHQKKIWVSQLLQGLI